MAASWRGDLLLLPAMAAATSFSSHPNASSPPLSGFARSPAQRPPAPNHGRGGGLLLPAMVAASLSSSRPSSSSAAGGPRRLSSPSYLFSPASGQRWPPGAAHGLPSPEQLRPWRRTSVVAARGEARRPATSSLCCSSYSLPCPTTAPPRQPQGGSLGVAGSRHIAAAVLRSPPSHRCKPKQHSGNLDLTRWWPIPLASRDCTTFLPNWRHHSEARSRWRQIRAAALLSTQAASLNVAARLVPHSSATDVGNKGATLCHYQRRPNRRRLLVVDLGQRRLLVLNRGAPTHAQGSKTLQIY